LEGGIKMTRRKNPTTTELNKLKREAHEYFDTHTKIVPDMDDIKDYMAYELSEKYGTEYEDAMNRVNMYFGAKKNPKKKSGGKKMARKPRGKKMCLTVYKSGKKRLKVSPKGRYKAKGYRVINPKCKHSGCKVRPIRHRKYCSKHRK